MKSIQEDSNNIERIVDMIHESAEIIRSEIFLELHNKAWHLFNEDFVQVWLEQEVGTEKYVLHLRRADLTETKIEARDYALEKISAFNDSAFNYYVWRVVIL